VKVPPESCHSIPEEIYKDACVSTTEEAVASCQVVGYPAMIKASWGGGGKGIRKVGFHFQLNSRKKKGNVQYSENMM
jgi:acetyl-CoA carboxylase/biotin carboxylase 1